MSYVSPIRKSNSKPHKEILKMKGRLWNVLFILEKLFSSLKLFLWLRKFVLDILRGIDLSGLKEMNEYCKSLWEALFFEGQSRQTNQRYL